jgi:uncharacterized protein (TIGR00251 family)
MRITVLAKPAARVPSIATDDGRRFTVAVTEPPREGRANAAIIRAVAEHFEVAPSRVHIVSGWSSRNKILEIGT